MLYPRAVRTLVWSVVLALAGASACAPEPAPTIDPGPEPRTDLVELIDPGAEPRKAFDYEPTLGLAVDIGAQLETRTVHTIDGETRRGGGVPTVVHVRYRVNDVDRRKFALSGTLVGVKMGRSDASLHDLVDIHAWTIFDYGGNPLDRSVDNTGRRGERLDALMRGLSLLRPPLPASPIGLGARWSTRQRISVAGMAFDGTTHYELVGVEGTMLTVGARTVLEPPGEGFVPPGVTSGTEFEVTRFEGSASATLRIDLGRPGWSNSGHRCEASLAYSVPSQDVSPLPHKITFDVTHVAQTYERARDG
jgi:hypothetical protein